MPCPLSITVTHTGAAAAAEVVVLSFLGGLAPGDRGSGTIPVKVGGGLKLSKDTDRSRDIPWLLLGKSMSFLQLGHAWSSHVSLPFGVGGHLGLLGLLLSRKSIIPFVSN